MEWNVYFIDAEGYEGIITVEAKDEAEARKLAKSDSIEILEIEPADVSYYID